MTIVKFSEISRTSWTELQPYLDTCIIPFTGLSGSESPVEMTDSLEKLRDFLDIVETRYKGRIVTYPAFHYGKQEDYKFLNEICHNIKKSGFKYVIIMTTVSIDEGSTYEHCDLMLSQPHMEKLQYDAQSTLSSIIQEEIESLWGYNR